MYTSYSKVQQLCMQLSTAHHGGKTETRVGWKCISAVSWVVCPMTEM